LLQQCRLFRRVERGGGLLEEVEIAGDDLSQRESPVPIRLLAKILSVKKQKIERELRHRPRLRRR